MKYPLLCFFLIIFALSGYGQTTKKVLFIGNSYTSVNNLPVMISDMATSTGDILIYDSNTPGGYRFMDHASNATTLAKINSNDWNYVALQAQSQETSLSEGQMQTEVYPYAQQLSEAIRANNECSQPIFYMTWGRENGDASNCPYIPWVCTYEGMDDAIRSSYLFMADANETELAPAGAVWRYIRDNHPGINLYSSDGSHPSVAGSYAAACAFYTIIYKKDPTLIPWNSTLSETTADLIRTVAKAVVFDAISEWHFSENPANADFSEDINGGEVTFTNTSAAFDSVVWDFGDSTTSTQTSPVHTYAESGTYTVTLTATKCEKSDSKIKNLEIDINLDMDPLKREPISIYPNPTNGNFNIQLGTVRNQIKILLVDLTGKIILNYNTVNSASISMDASHLSAGLYILKVSADDDFYVGRLHKN